MSEKALPYHEPPIETILVQASFILVLNFIGFALDRVLYCGLIGQIFIGVAWGAPAASWLSLAFQETAVQIGYLGLILVVYEGGLSTSTDSLKSNLTLSLAVAATGICLPIGLSFSLLTISNCTPVQAFAAGSALCSTSLGTTFSVLKTSGLISSRLGVVLTSAAMLDDIIGLVMVQIISNLGRDNSSITAATVARPIGVSLAFAILLPISCKFVVKRLILSRRRCRTGSLPIQFFGFIDRNGRGFLFHTFVLAAFVTTASYAGTSNLFAAYLAGAAISWYDTLDRKPSYAMASENSQQKTDNRGEEEANCSELAQNRSAQLSEQGLELSMQPTKSGPPNQTMDTAEDPKVAPSSPKVVCPKIPIQPNTPERLKKGEQPSPDASEAAAVTDASGAATKSPEHLSGKQIYDKIYAPPVNLLLMPFFFASIGFSIPISQLFHPSALWRGMVYALLMAMGKLACGLWLVRFSRRVPPRPDAVGSGHQWSLKSLPKPKSLYPASLLGSAMVARGEIGFLISAVAQSNGVFASGDAGGSSETPEMFLIVTWAILLCTVLGPLSVGLLSRRVKRLQKLEREEKSGMADPLGIWGII